MDKIRQLLGRITELSDEQLHELRDSILTEFDAMGSDPSRVMGVDEAETQEALAAAAAEEQAAIMGGDPWPYGFARNRDEVAAMIRFAVADGLAAEAIPPEALFHPSTLGETA